MRRLLILSGYFICIGAAVDVVIDLFFEFAPRAFVPKAPGGSIDPYGIVIVLILVIPALFIAALATAVITLRRKSAKDVQTLELIGHTSTYFFCSLFGLFGVAVLSAILAEAKA